MTIPQLSYEMRWGFNRLKEAVREQKKIFDGKIAAIAKEYRAMLDKSKVVSANGRARVCTRVHECFCVMVECSVVFIVVCMCAAKSGEAEH